MRRCRLHSTGTGVVVWALLMLLTLPLSARADKEGQIVLKPGGSQIIGSDKIWPEQREPLFKRVSAINTEIIDVQVVSPNVFYVFGKKPGSTSLILWEKELPEPKIVDVIVFLDLTALKQKLSEIYPTQDIKVYASETGVVLSGTVSGPEVVEQVIRLTQTFLPREAEDKGKEGGPTGTGRSGLGITNLLNVGGVQQVMLEVKFAEVSRKSDRDWQAALGLGGLSKNFTGAAGAGGSVLDQIVFPKESPGPFVFPGGNTGAVYDTTMAGVTQFPGTMLLNFANNPANVFVNIKNLTAALHFLESEGLARVLAEPRLVTQSGQEASFLAGGEFPIPVPQRDGNITIEFREFGVSLKFAPVVLSDGKISLRVAPSVSDIASTSVIPAGIQGASFIVPNLTTRKLETTVQLYDGQTLALAGLLQDNLRESVSKVPGLGDLPILGPLFRSTSYRQDKTDLLIAVTPRLVKPADPATLRFPGEQMKIPDRFEYYLEGRLEGRREVATGKDAAVAEAPPADSKAAEPQVAALAKPSLPQRGGLEGAFGHQPLAASPTTGDSP